jgi:hypothetical protein
MQDLGQPSSVNPDCDYNLYFFATLLASDSRLDGFGNAGVNLQSAQEALAASPHHGGGS